VDILPNTFLENKVTFLEKKWVKKLAGSVLGVKVGLGRVCFEDEVWLCRVCFEDEVGLRIF
jgi:hypothetical protein